MSKYLFIASFQESMCSQMFYKIDVPANSVRFIGNRLYQTLLIPRQTFLWEFFEIFRNTFSYRTPPHDCFWSQFHLFTVLRRFCFRTNQYLFNIPRYFRVYQNSWPRVHWVPILFLHRRNAIGLKINPALKTLMVFIS